MKDFFAALIPISICVVLPTLIVWLIGRVKQNETNRKAEIMLKALDNGAKIDTDFFKSPRPRSSRDFNDKAVRLCGEREIHPCEPMGILV